MKILTARHKTRQRQQGLAIVEFTITLPLLLLLIFATAEIGRVFYQYSTLTKAIRDGARYLAARAESGDLSEIDLTDDLVVETQNLVVYGNTAGTGDPVLDGLTTDDVTVTNPAGTSQVSVNASFTYAPIFSDTLPTFGLGEPISLTFPLNATVVMGVLL